MCQYEFKLMCSTNEKEYGTFNQLGMHGGSEEYDGNGNCTLIITEFGATEGNGGTYNDDLRIGRIFLGDYISIRNYFKNIEDNQEITNITWSTDGAGNDKNTYKHEGKLTFKRIANPGSFS